MSDSGGGGGAFDEKYAATLRSHVDVPGEHGLRAAAELGRAARDSGVSMLQLVGLHLDVRRALVVEQGIDHLADMDAFLSAALAAFDAEQHDNREPASAHRDRLEWLQGLSDAYIAIASGTTLEARVSEVCTQTRRFLGAADSRLEFGRQAQHTDAALVGDEISAYLLGSAGLLTVTAPAGRTWIDAERTALQQLAALISAPINDARRLELSERAGRLGALLGGVADPDELLTRVRGEGVDEIGADRVIVRLFDGEPDGEWPQSIADAIDRIARGGSLQVLECSGEESDECWAVLPLGTGPGRLGVLATGFKEPQPFDEVQLSFLADVAQRLTAALERSRAYAAERTTRQEVELASARLSDLQGLASELARAATRRRVAQVLLRRAGVSSGAVAGFVAVFTTYPLGDVLAATGVFRSDRWTDVGSLVSELQPGPRRRERVEVLIVDVRDLHGAAGRRLAAEGLAQIAWVPVMSGERDIGVLVLAWYDHAEPRIVDRSLLEAQVAMAGSTLQRAARYDVEHAIAETLQRSLLALPPLSLERVRWSVLYRSGSVGLAGGDWYDLIELDAKRLAIVVGDIVGRGVEAAASMGQLRSATRALATRIDDPAELLGALDQYALSTGQGHYSSLAYVLLDSSSGRLSYCVAGHPPPILRLPDGSVSVLESGRGPLLGMRCERRAATCEISAGTRLLMYTDGLVDSRDESIDVGIGRLLGEMQDSRAELEPEAACRELIERLLPQADGGHESRDDVAIVMVDLLAGD